MLQSFRFNNMDQSHMLRIFVILLSGFHEFRKKYFIQFYTTSSAHRIVNFLFIILTKLGSCLIVYCSPFN